MILYSGSNLSGSNRRLSRLRSTGSSTTQRSLELVSSRFSQHGSTLSHLNNNLLHLHMMNTTMNRQQRKTVHTDMNRMMISLQHNNLILRPNLKPKTTSHSQATSSSLLPRASTRPSALKMSPPQTTFDRVRFDFELF